MKDNEKGDSEMKRIRVGDLENIFEGDYMNVLLRYGFFDGENYLKVIEGT